MGVVFSVRFFGGALGLLLLALVMLVLRVRATHKARRQETAGGCVVCSSTRVSDVSGVSTCLACGYVGRSDRGGTLSKREIAAMYQIEQDRH